MSMKFPRFNEEKLNIYTALFNQIITIVCGIFLPRILIGSFGSEAYGISVSIAQFLSYITLLEGGIGGVARAELYGPLAKKDADATGAVYYAIKRFFNHVAAIFVVYSLGLGLVYYSLAHVKIFTRTYVFMLVVVISLATLAKYVGGLTNLILIVASKKQYINNLIMAATTLINVIAVALLVYWGCDLIWVKLGSSLIFIVRPILYSIYVKKNYCLPAKVKKRTILEQKWTGIGQHIAYFLHKNTDVVLLTLLADLRLVAVYSVYNMIISNIRSLTESFSSGMEAVFGELLAKGEFAALQKAFQKYKVLLSAASLILFCCTGILIVPFVKLYTNGITDADYIQPVFAIVLLLAEAINCLALPCSCLTVAANHLKQSKWGAYCEAIINIVVSLLLIQWNPLIGVALGTLVATAFRGLYYMVYSSKHILCCPIFPQILTFLGNICLLCLAIVGGGKLIMSVQMSSFFQWIKCGVAVFISVFIPVAGTAYLYIKHGCSLR